MQVEEVVSAPQGQEGEAEGGAPLEMVLLPGGRRVVLWARGPSVREVIVEQLRRCADGSALKTPKRRPSFYDVSQVFCPFSFPAGLGVFSSLHLIHWTLP